MEKYIGLVSLLVHDYEEALDFYIHKLGFELVEDKILTPEKRWVVVKPPHTKGHGCNLLLAKASGAHQAQFVGNQSGGRVLFFLFTDNILRDFEALVHHQVNIVRPLSEEEYGKVLVFADLYGNLWDLIEPKR